MDSVSTFVMLLSMFDCALTAPTAANLAVLARGAVLTHGERTVSACLMAAWPWAGKSYDAYCAVPRSSRLDMLRLARLLTRMVLRLIGPDTPVRLVVDETLVRRWGPRIIGLGIHRDPVRSARSSHVFSAGHKWVVLSIAVRIPGTERALALPVLCALYTPARPPARNRCAPLYRRHRTVPELTLILVRLLAGQIADRDVLVAGDGAYGTHELARYFQPESSVPALRRVCLISRFYFDGATYARPASYSGTGRPRIVGEKLPNPRSVSQSPNTVWEQTTVRWYGAKVRPVLLCSRTGLWYKGGEGAKWIRWVLVRDPEGQRRDEVFFTTCAELSPVQIVETYVIRWSIETTFAEARRHLGLESLRNWSVSAVKRSVPLLFGLYTLVVIWFHQEVEEPESHLQQRPWYKKDHLTFSDMLAAARGDILGELVSEHHPPSPREQLLWRLSCGSTIPGCRAKRPAA